MNLAENGAENYDWNSEGVYQLEVTDRVQGGPGGVANRQAAELANRTRNLHGRVQNVEVNKAPLASPALTGTPTAPTAALGTNNTQIANTAFVQALVAALVNSSPAALDTLKELASALGNDANFATTMTNALAGKLGVGAKAADSSLFNGQQNSEFLRYLGGLNGEYLDSVNENGIGLVNYPGHAEILLSINFGGSVGSVQQMFDHRGMILWRNKTDNNVWTAWKELWHTGNLNPSQMAPLTSPSFTGIPTAPTAATGTNTMQLANTAFVQAALAALVNSSPAALDTLNELATALGNDPNFATTMTNALAGKASVNHIHNRIAADYIGGGLELPNYFGGNLLKLQMLRIPGFGWVDALWMSSYGEPDEPLSNQLVFGKNSNYVGYRQQNYNSENWGELISFWTTANMDIVGSSDLPGSDIDWSGKPVRTKTLTANTTLSFSNLIVNKTITLRITGAFTLILPASVTTISGEYDGSKVNLIQLLCINSAVPEVWCVISQPKA